MLNGFFGLIPQVVAAKLWSGTCERLLMPRVPLKAAQLNSRAQQREQAGGCKPEQVGLLNFKNFSEPPSGSWCLDQKMPLQN